MSLSEITPKHITQYIKKRLDDGVKNKTINLELSVLRRMFNLAKKWNYNVVRNPVEREDFLPDEDSIRDRVLTHEEQKKLMKEAASHLKPIIQCALFQALRLQEILKLRIDDVDFDIDEITIRQEISKNKKQDKIPIMPEFRPVLHKLVKKNGGRTDFVFNYQDPRNGRFRPITTIQHAFQAACRRASIQGLQFRDLRRTCATRLHESGVDPLVVSRFLRHSSVRISSDVYIQSSLRLMKRELERLQELEPAKLSVN